MYQRNMNTFGLAFPQNFQLFHYTQGDGHIYHVTCRLLKGFSHFVSDDHDYDHRFFYQNSVANYYVMCKLLSHDLIVHILNTRYIYGIDVDVLNNVRQRNSLSLTQKFNLEQELREILPYHINSHGNVGNNVMTTQVAMAEQFQQWFASPKQSWRLFYSFKQPSTSTF